MTLTNEKRGVGWHSTVALFVLLISSTAADAQADSAAELFSEGARRYGLADFEGSLRVLNCPTGLSCLPESFHTSTCWP